MAYSYQTGTSTDLWIAYMVTGIPIVIGVVIAILILFLLILRYATKRKIAKSRLILLDGLRIKPNLLQITEKGTVPLQKNFCPKQRPPQPTFDTTDFS